MTLSAYQLNTQYQSVSLSYDAKITPVQQEQSSQIENKASDEGVNTLVPIVFTDESNLSTSQNFQKLLLQNILNGFENNGNGHTLYPNGEINKNIESYQRGNPYAENMNNLPQGFLYNSSSEYYEKTTIDFSAQARVKTPDGEYNIEINFSYTKEFYEKNETQIQIANKNFEKPIDIKLDKDDNSLKDLKSLHFLFDVYKEENEDKKDIFEQIKELLAARREAISEMFENMNKDNENRVKPLDNFKIWQENSNHEMDLVAVQKDGVGVFLANASTESSMLSLNVGENAYSLKASYSNSSFSYTEVSNELDE